MSYELFTRGSQGSEKVEIKCPKCGIQNYVFWFPKKLMEFRRQGTTGGSEKAFSKKAERVEGTCKCGYVFSKKDLDEDADIDEEVSDDDDWDEDEE